MTTKFTVSVMVLRVVSFEGHVMPPVFIEEGHRVNADVYVGLLEDHVLPWMTNIANGQDYVFQQDLIVNGTFINFKYGFSC